jgi:hypothetical protein
MRTACAALALALLTAATGRTTELIIGPVKPAPHVAPESCAPGGCSCLHRLLGWFTYRGTQSHCCCTLCNCCRYCRPPLNTYFLTMLPQCGHPGCAAAHPVNAVPYQVAPSPTPPPPPPARAESPPAQASAAPCTSCGCGRFLDGWHFGKLFGY